VSRAAAPLVSPMMRPLIAVVGRPNVGKSSLFNRLVGRRRALVRDVPGVTRDRLYGQVEFERWRATVIDTGGFDPSSTEPLVEAVRRQVLMAIEDADLILFVVDAREGVTALDQEIAGVLRRADRPVVLVANKVDDRLQEPALAELYRLGFGDPLAVSAEHGRGVAEMLQAVRTRCPTPGPVPAVGPAPVSIAIIGRPNVGKSSLLNKVAKEDRVVVSDVAGTTVDPVDELITLGGREWRFIDTAGIRRKVKNAQGHEYYASLRTNAAIERAEVVVVVIDASEVMSEQDLRIMNAVEEAGKALVIAYNKWDLVDEDRRYYLEREIDRDLVQFRWAPRVNISALTGRHMEKLVPAIEAALEGWQTRVPTGQLNAFLGRLVAAHPHPVRSGKQPKILFGTQATTMPPTFAIFTSGQIEPSYQRFIERRLREDFGFVGSPVHVQIRARQKKPKR
jgi:GTPase